MLILVLGNQNVTPQHLQEYQSSWFLHCISLPLLCSYFAEQLVPNSGLEPTPAIFCVRCGFRFEGQRPMALKLIDFEWFPEFCHQLCNKPQV